MLKFLATAAVAAILAVSTGAIFAQDQPQMQGQMPMQGGAQMPMMRG